MNIRLRMKGKWEMVIGLGKQNYLLTQTNPNNPKSKTPLTTVKKAPKTIKYEPIFETAKSLTLK